MDEEPKALNTELDTVSYSLGLSIGQNLQQQGLGDVDVEYLAQGIKAAMAEEGEPLIAVEEAQAHIQKYMMKQQQAALQENQQAGNEFLQKNLQKEGVQETASGLQYEVLEKGTGESPAATDTVRVHYHGTLTSGEVFDSSVERDEPAEFPLNRVIPGWTEGVQLMKEGGKYRFYVPPQLAYGERGAPPKIGPNEVLIFEVELLEVK